MAVSYTQPYRTIRTSDTSAQDPVCVATMHLLADNISVMKRVLAPRVWDVGIPSGIPSLDADTNENIVKVYGPIPHYSGYDKWTWGVGHYRVGAMSDNTTWMLYSTGVPPPYTQVLDTSELGEYAADTTGVTTSSGTHAFGVREKALDIVARNGSTWLILTATNAGTSGTSTCTTFDAIMKPADA